MIKEKQHVSEDELSAYRGKWKNLYFRKDGTFLLDPDCIFNTEVEAKHDIDSSLPLPLDEEFYFYFSEEIITGEDYSHTIQIQTKVE